MRPTDNAGVADVPGRTLKNDPSLLVESVRDSIDEKINGINRSAEREIRKFSDEIQNDVGSFRAGQQKKIDDLIAYEEGRMRNLTSIEMKKQKLEVVDAFINRIIKFSIAALRPDSRYAEFLKQCVMPALENVAGGRVTVSLSPSDMNYSDLIKNEIRDRGCKLEVMIKSDEHMESGGAIVTDEESEVVFNNTVERIVYRRMDEIKRIIVKELNEYINGVEKS
ncbi:MAG TPA: V-type ATP synthase subunit E family protein [Spirochaetota bacterium]|nr:V-type ATP synthase subunit E family protein [Spirochaetota bacterium]HPJ34243.1 V-type ATP synthase subunit E family protein [Spirochaetota bacterium]